MATKLKNYLYVLMHTDSGLLYVGLATKDPRKYPPVVDHWKWDELLSKEAFSTTLVFSKRFKDSKSASRALRVFKKENKVQSLTCWVNSDYYKDIISPYVYLIKHRPSGMLYVGSRYAPYANPSKFFKDYFTSSKRVKELGTKSFEVVQVLAQPNAREKEQKLLRDFYKRLGKDDFVKTFLNRNLAPGILLDEAAIEKMKASKRLNSRKGIPHTADHSANISKSLKGHHVSDETRAKIRHSAKTRKRRPHSEETKAKMREARRRRGPMSAETRAKISASRLGSKASEATRAKLSAIHMKRYENDPSLRERISTSVLLAHVKDPSIRERQGVKSKALWEEAEYKESMCKLRKQRANTKEGHAHMVAMNRKANKEKTAFIKKFKDKHGHQA